MLTHYIFIPLLFAHTHFIKLRKKLPQSWVFNILKRESTIPPNEEIIRHNICNVELQPNVCDV